MLDLDVDVGEKSKEEDITTSYREFEKHFDKFDHRYFTPLSNSAENLVEKRIYKPRDEQQDLEFAGKMWCWFCKHTVEGHKNLMWTTVFVYQTIEQKNMVYSSSMSLPIPIIR